MNTSCESMQPDHGCQLLKKLNDQREQAQFCDVIVKVCNEVNFPAHRCVLAASSQKFHAMMCKIGSFKTDGCSSVVLSELNGNGFQPVLEYIYTGILNINSHNVHDVLNTASFFSLSYVSDFCNDFLKSAHLRPKAKKARLMICESTKHGNIMRNIISVFVLCIDILISYHTDLDIMCSQIYFEPSVGIYSKDYVSVVSVLTK